MPFLVGPRETRIRRAPQQIATGVAGNAPARVIRRDPGSVAEEADKRLDALTEEYRSRHTAVVRSLRTIGAIERVEELDEEQVPKQLDTRAGRAAWASIRSAARSYGSASAGRIPGGARGAAEQNLQNAVFSLKRASTLLSVDGATGREMVAAKAGTAKTSAQLQELVGADADRRAGEVFQIFRGHRGSLGDDVKSFNRLAQWLSDGTGGQITAAYARVHTVLTDLLDDEVPPPEDLVAAIKDTFGANSPRTTYLLELVHHGRLGPEGKLIAALGLLGPKLAIGSGTSSTAILSAAQGAPPRMVKELLSSYGSKIPKKVRALLDATAEREAVSQSIQATKPLGLEADDVVDAATRTKVEQRYLDALLAQYGHKRDKLQPHLLRWSRAADPTIIQAILRPTLKKFYAAQARQDMAMKVDVELFIDMLVGSAAVSGLDMADPDSERSQSGRRLVQLEALIADHKRRNIGHDELSKGGPPGTYAQLLTSPLVKGEHLMAMLESVLDDGEVVRALVARHGSAQAAREALAKELAPTTLSDGNQAALLDRIMFGKSRSGEGYGAFVRHVLDAAPKKDKAKREFTAQLVGFVAGLEPGERDLVRRNDRVLAAMLEKSGGDAVDASNWWTVLGALGITINEVRAAARRQGQLTGSAGEAGQIQGITVGGTGPATETDRLLDYQDERTASVAGAETQSVQFWSARVSRLLSSEFGDEKNVVSAVAVLMDAQLSVGGDPGSATKLIGQDVARESSSWKKRISAASSSTTPHRKESAKRRVARILATGAPVTTADIMHVHQQTAKKAKGKVTKLQTASAKTEEAWVSLPSTELILNYSNFGEIAAGMYQGVFPRLVLDLAPERHKQLADALPRVKRLDVVRSIRDRLADAAAEQGSPVEQLFLQYGLTPEQAQLFAIQTRAMGDLDKERLLLSGVQWTRFNSLSQLRRQARNEELSALRGARTDMSSVPTTAVKDVAERRTEQIRERSDDTRAAQDKFSAMRKRYRDRIITALNILFTIAFTVASLGFGLPAAAAWIQILATSLWIVATTVTTELVKWALMGDSQSLTESLITILFSIPTSVVAGFVTGPLGFSADVGLRMALEGLKEGAPALEIALRSFLIGNINRALNAPVTGLQSWLTSEKDPEGTLHRVKGEVASELIHQVKAIGMSVLKGVAKAAVPEGMVESDMSNLMAEDGSKVSDDERLKYVTPYSGGDISAAATYAYSPTGTGGQWGSSSDQVGWSAALRGAGADIRNTALEMTIGFIASRGGPGDQPHGFAKATGETDPAIGLDEPLNALYQHMNAQYAKAFFAADDRSAVVFDPRASVAAYLRAHRDAANRVIAQYGTAAVRQRIDQWVDHWTTCQPRLHRQLAGLPLDIVAGA